MVSNFQTGQFLQAFYTLKNSDNLPGNQTNGRGSRLSKHPLCPKDLLQTSACHPSHRTDFSLPNSFQGRLSESSLSKHLTCVSRTYSQPQPIAILSMFISRQVVGAFTVQTPHLCLRDLLPTSACRDTPSISKHVISGNHLTSHLHSMTSQSTCHTSETKKHTSSQLRILKLFDALDFTSAMYQPSDHFRTLVQAQHVSLRKRFRSSIQTTSASP